MNNDLTIKNSITINAPAAKVWDALINPDMTKEYMFGCRTDSNWKVGSPLLWRGSYEDHEMVFVKGHIVEIEPEKYLAYTTIDPNDQNIPDIPENYLTVTYSLADENGSTVLTITQGDYSKVADGKKRYKEMQGRGWELILEKIEELAEDPTDQ